MRLLLWDASGLAKRYYPEPGAETVDALFAASPPPAMTLAFMGYAETSAILRRKFNGGLMTAADFQQARLVLEAGVLLNPDSGLLTITDRDFLDGMALTDRHNLNTADAAMLAAFLRLAATQPAGDLPCLLVAADRRLLRAARAEGSGALNPEMTAPADVLALLGN